MLRDFSLEKFDIIIQAGQSNSEGCGIGNATVPFVQGPDIFYMENDLSICTAHEYVSGNYIIANFSLSFSRRYMSSGFLEPGRKILILRAAVGGTGFRDKRWGINDDLYLKMVEMTKTALELNPQNRLAALLWHQGETDAILNAGRQEHYDNLTQMVNSVRNTFNCPDLPFIAGDFVSHWKNDNLAICIPVVEAIKDVCASVGYAAFVETDGLTSNAQVINNDDTIHFSREAQYQLGDRYFDVFVRIKNAK